ncbi:MAG: hypothetical protein Q7T28_09285 [Cypionkella sp.]|nr:hypothetical protein [Cypionkella sp.]
MAQLWHFAAKPQNGHRFGRSSCADRPGDSALALADFSACRTDDAQLRALIRFSQQPAANVVKEWQNSPAMVNQTPTHNIVA